MQLSLPMLAGLDTLRGGLANCVLHHRVGAATDVIVRQHARSGRTHGSCSGCPEPGSGMPPPVRPPTAPEALPACSEQISRPLERRSTLPASVRMPQRGGSIGSQLYRLSAL